MVSKFIPLSVPNLKGNELKYITEAVETEWVSTAGRYVSEFEKNIAEYTGASGAVSCQNGTAGLHVALRLCGVESGDEVIVPALTFIAAVNPVKYLGAEPVFMDCDDSLCMDPEKLESFCENECELKNNILINKYSGRKIKAIIAVHVFGNMADLESLVQIAQKYNLKLIEDATEALGTYYINNKYKGRFAGTVGDIGVYSFNGNKIITTGGGGMIISNNHEFLSKAKHLTTQAKADELYFVHDDIGYNYRMTNIQAAMGIAQLEQLEGFINIKKENYFLYKNLLQDIKGARLIEFRADIRPNYWFYSLLLEGCKLNRDGLIKYLSENKIQSRPVWALINEQKPYKNCQAYLIKKAKYYVNHIVNIPCSSNLLSEDVEYIAGLLNRVL